jgi:hypothetical protein
MPESATFPARHAFARLGPDRGQRMSGGSYHRGILYLVRDTGEGRWKWEIQPPDCIRGLRAESGEVEGRQADAVIAAKKAIDSQTQAFTGEN